MTTRRSAASADSRRACTDGNTFEQRAEPCWSSVSRSHPRGEDHPLGDGSDSRDLVTDNMERAPVTCAAASVQSHTTNAATLPRTASDRTFRAIARCARRCIVTSIIRSNASPLEIRVDRTSWCHRSGRSRCIGYRRTQLLRDGARHTDDAFLRRRIRDVRGMAEP